MLEVNDLTVHYGRVAALRAVSLRVEEGELVSVVGPNGAGKSTLLMTLAGALAPSGGTVAFRGARMPHRAEDVVRRGIALVPERRRIFTTLSVEENLKLGMTALTDKARRASGLARALERFPILKERYKMPAATLSGGQQQQLAIARALVAHPKLLLVDEPSLGLAPKIVDQTFEAMVELRAEGTTILLVEQNAMRAVAIADRAYVLSRGRVEAETSPESTLSKDEVLRAYFGSGDGA